MCNSVHKSGREHETPGELAKLVGGVENLVWQTENPFVGWPEGKDWHELDLCLCSIDVPNTLTNAALKWHRGDDPMEYFVEEAS